MSLKNIDHVAITVSDYDARIQLLTTTMGLTLKREGRLAYDPARRVAILGDAAGFKMEIIEGESDGFDHVAWLVDDVAASTQELVEAGCTVKKPLFRIAPAKADSANLAGVAGFPLQLVRYDADSPDL